MRQFTAPTLSLALALLLLGCTQASLPAGCANASPGSLSNCIYVAAVLGQNPYDCYSLQDGAQREKCLRDASDSAARKLLEQMTPSERARIFAAAASGSDASGISAPLPQAAAEPAPPAPPQAVINPPSRVSTEDSQAYSQAIATNGMAACATITDVSTRASCITQVALQVKNPSVCSPLSQKADIDLCNLYAKGGEQAK
jgi:hypothetical protein